MSAQKAPVSPLLSVAAGATAGGIESLVTVGHRMHLPVNKS